MLDILEYQFMQLALIAGVVIAILSSIAGSFIVLKRYSMITETLAHASLVGVAIGLTTGMSPLWFAMGVALLSALLIEYLRSTYRLYSDSILAIFLSASLAIAVILVSVGGSFNTSLFSYLFGSILSVKTEDLYVIIAFGSLSLLLLWIFRREFYFIAFDEEVAKTSGIKVKALNFLLVAISAIIIALSIRIIGSLLIGALMVIPTVSALRFKKGFGLTMLLALIFSLFSVLSGIIASYYLSLPSGATIVIVLVLMFIFSLVVNRR